MSETESEDAQLCLTLCDHMDCCTPGLLVHHQLTELAQTPDHRLTGKDSDAGRAWGQEEKGTTEDEMAGWHH